MLWCIICKIEQVGARDLWQCFTLQKGLIKYGKINGITPMKAHVESTHPKLVVCKQLAITKELVTASHS
jgi:hypothetical protein